MKIVALLGHRSFDLKIQKMTVSDETRRVQVNECHVSFCVSAEGLEQRFQ